jgi:GNAT superfamily N-acetyltransferase
MHTIRRAAPTDSVIIASIGMRAVEASHRASSSAEDMAAYLSRHYTEEAIKMDIDQDDNIYHLLYLDNQPVGFSKIILNAEHPNVPGSNFTKLDRIYLLSEFHGKKLGFELMQFNIDYSREQGQAGMWLFTWTGNERAVDFYKKVGFTIIGSHQFKLSETHYNPNHQMLLQY